MDAAHMGGSTGLQCRGCRAELCTHCPDDRCRVVEVFNDRCQFQEQIVLSLRPLVRVGVRHGGRSPPQIPAKQQQAGSQKLVSPCHRQQTPCTLKARWSAQWRQSRNRVIHAAHVCGDLRETQGRSAGVLAPGWARSQLLSLPADAAQTRINVGVAATVMLHSRERRAALVLPT